MPHLAAFPSFCYMAIGNDLARANNHATTLTDIFILNIEDVHDYNRWGHFLKNLFWGIGGCKFGVQAKN
ncbi:hypothetical protein NTGZN8_140026 [Candidatus Nitrotoga fabula]|uniref:Uncharacterized protein n=1 Tax=Candidatus Nitrotoga fabula TaxID=2182327 RepID=A0A916BF38_9PROT|nr:hypothetical protein NTGZN8_140026 [Candidatus Nitrotoga fabula]